MKVHATLLGLPPELRLPIYREVFEDMEVRVTNNLPYNISREEAEVEMQYPNAWTILHICKAIREETFDLFYESVKFNFEARLEEPKLCAWMDALGPRAIRNLRRLYFHCSNRCRMYGVQADNSMACIRYVFCNLRMPEREFIRRYDPDRQPTSEPEENPERWRPSNGQTLWCSHHVETCRERTKDNFEDAVRRIKWEKGKPALVSADVLEMRRSVNSDNHEYVLACLGNKPLTRASTGRPE